MALDIAADHVGDFCKGLLNVGCGNIVRFDVQHFARRAANEFLGGWKNDRTPASAANLDTACLTSLKRLAHDLVCELIEGKGMVRQTCLRDCTGQSPDD